MISILIKDLFIDIVHHVEDVIIDRVYRAHIKVPSIKIAKFIAELTKIFGAQSHKLKTIDDVYYIVHDYFIENLARIIPAELGADVARTTKRVSGFTVRIIIQGEKDQAYVTFGAGAGDVCAVVHEYDAGPPLSPKPPVDLSDID